MIVWTRKCGTTSIALSTQLAPITLGQHLQALGPYFYCHSYHKNNCRFKEHNAHKIVFGKHQSAVDDGHGKVVIIYATVFKAKEEA